MPWTISKITLYASAVTPIAGMLATGIWISPIDQSIRDHDTLVLQTATSPSIIPNTPITNIAILNDAQAICIESIIGQHHTDITDSIPRKGGTKSISTI